MIESGRFRLNFGLARLAMGAAIAVTLLLALSASRAHAATEIGAVPTGAEIDLLMPCSPGFNLVQNSSTGPSYDIPAAGGVITSWSHQGAALAVPRATAAGVAPGSGRLLLWSPGAGPSHTLVGGSVVEDFSIGLNTFETRVPVSGGERLGLRTNAGPVGCISNGYSAGDVGSAEGPGATDPQPGDPRTLADISQAMTRVNVAATLESDADADGFGDESQDVELEVTLKNRLRPKRSGFPVRVSCGVTECDGTITGKAVAKQKGGSSATAAKKKKKKSFKLKPKTLSICSYSSAAAAASRGSRPA